MNLTKVTITGADDSVNPFDLIEISKKYPFVEFGILLSKKHIAAGAPRFPTTNWTSSLGCYAHKHGIKLSAHICGKWVRDIMVGDWAILNEGHIVLLNACDRIQFNFNAATHAFDADAFLDHVGKIQMRMELSQYIFQHDGVNNHCLKAAERAGMNAVPLFDLSGGTGALPLHWPSSSGFDHGCGYAGGLSPENVADQLAKIEKVCGDKEIWIDVETKVRSADNLHLDLGKVDAFLRAASGFVNKECR